MRLTQIYNLIRFADNPDRTDIHDQPTTDSCPEFFPVFPRGSEPVQRHRRNDGHGYNGEPNPHKTVRYLQQHGDVGIVVDSCYYYTIFSIKSQVVKNPPKCASVRGRVGMWLFGYSFIVWWPIFPRLVGPWPCVGQLDCCRYCPWHSSDPFGQWLDLHQLLAL